MPKIDSDTIAHINQYLVQGRNGVGAIAVPGINVGDVVILVFISTFDVAVSPLFYFEKVITVANQIQQLNIANLTTQTFRIIVVG